MDNTSKELQDIGMINRINNGDADDDRKMATTALGTNMPNDVEYGSQTKTLDRKDWIKDKLLAIAIGFLGELFGTFMLTLFVILLVAAAVITEAQVGIWQVALPTGLGVSLSIIISAHISDAHLNPAVTAAFAVIRFRQFHWILILPYMAGQLCGGILAGAALYLFYHGPVAHFEMKNNITRGEAGSELSAMIFGEYFPNPAVYPHSDPDNLAIISPFMAFLTEVFGTMLLVFIVFSITNKRNTTIGSFTIIIPLCVAFTVATIISVFGPLTQACLNPARDFGPRIVAAIAGWGRIAIPGPRSGFWLYILGPLIGGPLGGGLSDLLLIVDNYLRTKKNAL
jgi:MIP family channel proteins